MDKELEERLKREKETYNDEALDRQELDSTLWHCYYHSELHSRNLIADALSLAHGKVALELGSKSWFYWLYEKGIVPEKLQCINLSETELDKGRELAEKTKDYPVQFQVDDAHSLSFPDNSFDVVFGNAILHHLEIPKAIAEIKRVTKPNGYILFQEPLNINPIYKLYRLLNPQQRTDDEKAFTHQELSLLNKHFDFRSHYLNHLSIPIGVVNKKLGLKYDSGLTKFAFGIDKGLSNVPLFRKLYSRILIHGKIR